MFSPAVRNFACRRAASSLVVAEVNGAGELQPATMSAITAASELGGDVSVLVAAEDAAAAAAQVAGVAGVSAVLAASGAQYKPGFGIFFVRFFHKYLRLRIF